MSLTLREARTIIDAAVKKAEELGQRAAIAVVDDAGRVLSVDQMDGVALHRDRFAVGKAMAAVVLGQPTAEAVEMQKSNPARYFGVIGMLPGQLYILAGGVPLQADGRMVGAVGVAGGAAGTDDKIAEAGIAAWRG